MYQTHHTHYSNSGNLLFHPLIVTLYGLVVNVSPQYMIHRVNVLLTLGLSVGFIYGEVRQKTRRTNSQTICSRRTVSQHIKHLQRKHGEQKLQTYLRNLWEGK